MIRIRYNGQTLEEEHEISWKPADGPFPVAPSSVFAIVAEDGEILVGAIARAEAMLLTRKHGVLPPP